MQNSKLVLCDGKLVRVLNRPDSVEFDNRRIIHRADEPLSISSALSLVNKDKLIDFPQQYTKLGKLLYGDIE